MMDKYGKWYQWIPILGMWDADPYKFNNSVRFVYTTYQIFSIIITLIFVWTLRL